MNILKNPISIRQISIIVPVYNEQTTVERVIEKLRALKFNKEIIIVDDGSTDNTKDILKKYESLKGVYIFFHARNSGKGEAVKTGVAKANGDYIIIQDADMEQDPDDIEKFFPEIEKRGYKAVFGTRVLEWGVEYNIRHTANLLFSFLTNILFKTHLTDIMTGYKMIEADIFKSLLLTSDRFGIEPEITIRLIEKGIPIKEVPVSYTPRGVKEGKKIRSVDGFSVIYIIVKLFLKIKISGNSSATKPQRH